MLESVDLGSNPLSLNHYMLSRKLLNFSESVSSFVKWGENMLLARLFEDYTYCINMSMTYIRTRKQTDAGKHDLCAILQLSQHINSPHPQVIKKIKSLKSQDSLHR